MLYTAFFSCTHWAATCLSWACIAGITTGVVGLFMTPVPRDKILAVEATVLAQLPCRTTQHNVDLPSISVVGGDLRVTLRVLHFQQRIDAAAEPNKRRPTMVLLHGSSASSLGYLPVIAHLVHDFDVYAIDLPGFGISTTSPASVFRALDPQSLIEFYTKALHLCAKHFEWNKQNKVHLVGHSLGAYLSVHFAHSYPQTVETLVLMDPAGLLPTFGDVGIYWALFFKIGLPVSFFRALGRVPALLHALCQKKDKETVCSLSPPFPHPPPSVPINLNYIFPRTAFFLSYT